jgi:hypothetical protein
MSKSNAKAAAERMKNQNALKETNTDTAAQGVVKDSSLDTAAQSPAEGSNVDTEIENLKAAIEDRNTLANTSGKEENALDKDANVESIEERSASLSQVEFIAPYKRYSKGDIAAFSSDTAAELIEKKVAVLPGETIELESEPV